MAFIELKFYFVKLLAALAARSGSHRRLNSITDDTGSFYQKMVVSDIYS